MRECEKTTRKREIKGKKEVLVIFLVRGGRLVPALYAKIVKKARRFIRRTTIEIGPAYDRLRMSRKHDPERWRREKRGLDKRERLLNGTRLYVRGSSRRSYSRSSLYFRHGTQDSSCKLVSRSYRRRLKSRAVMPQLWDFTRARIWHLSDTANSIPKMAILATSC